MTVVNEHETELGRVEKQFVSYFLANKPFIVGDHLTVADLLAACEFEQPAAGGYQLSPPVLDYLNRVKTAVGQDYDNIHSTLRKLGKKNLC